LPLDDDAIQALILVERFIAQTERVVHELADEFREAMNDPRNFGPAKAALHAMRADSVDVADPEAITAWIAGFNAPPRRSATCSSGYPKTISSRTRLASLGRHPRRTQTTART
jgi:hypothetical protein